MKLKNRQGFTLVELMTVMAIIGILATAIMVSLSVHKKRAEGNKTLTELSGVMQNIYLCKADDGIVTAPATAGGGNICGIGDEYGVWPTPTKGFNYISGTNFNAPAGGWFYGASSTDVTICCNSKSGKCQELDAGETCGVQSILK